MDRSGLLEPKLALNQQLTRMATALASTRNRQRWPGAIQRTTDGAGAADTDNSEIVISEVALDPGTWFLVARASISLSSTPGVPTYSGTEQFRARLSIVDTADVPIEDLDSDTLAPAVDSLAFTGGFYANSLILIGSGTWDVSVSARLIVSSDDPNAVDHLIVWGNGKIIALPF